MEKEPKAGPGTADDVIDDTCPGDEPGASGRRSVVWRAQTPVELAATLTRAHSIDPGLAHVLCIMRFLGLSTVEALLCVHQLPDWLVVLRLGAQYVPLKQGVWKMHSRRIEIIASQRRETIHALEAALDYADAHDGKLVKGGSLKIVRNRLRTLLRDARIGGELSSRSIRFSYAVSLTDALIAAGVTPEQARERVLASLGHGRRAYVALEIYLQEMSNRSRSV